MSKIRAVLFDLYDTLVEIKIDDYIESKQKIAERAGVETSAFIDGWKKHTKASAQGKIKSVTDRIVLTLRELGKEVPVDLANELAQIEIDLQENKVHKLPGCDDTLKVLKEMGLKIGLVTNTSSVSKNLIAKLGIGNWFDCEIYSYEIGILKPDVAIYKLASQRIGVDENEIIFVGDGNDLELNGAKNAGMIAVKVGGGRDQILSSKQSTGFDYEIKDLGELIPLVQKIISE